MFNIRPSRTGRRSTCGHDGGTDRLATLTTSPPLCRHGIDSQRRLAGRIPARPLKRCTQGCPKPTKPHRPSACRHLAGCPVWEGCPVRPGLMTVIRIALAVSRACPHAADLAALQVRRQPRATGGRPRLRFEASKTEAVLATAPAVVPSSAEAEKNRAKPGSAGKQKNSSKSTYRFNWLRAPRFEENLAFC